MTGGHTPTEERLRDVDVCMSCLTNPAEHGAWCDECYQSHRPARRDRKVQRAQDILNVVTAEAPSGISP